jgi:UDP-glucose 4-epimerase
MERGIEMKRSQWAKNKNYMYWICDMSTEKRIWQFKHETHMNELVFSSSASIY